MPSFSLASRTKLATCDIRLQVILNEAIKYIDFIILEGHRNEEAQNLAFAAGASKLKWPHGKHNAFPSRAVDIAPYFPKVAGKIDWADLVAFGRLMGYIQRIADERGVKLRFGCDWDGDFHSVNRDPDEFLFDCPHIELVE